MCFRGIQCFPPPPPPWHHHPFPSLHTEEPYQGTQTYITRLFLLLQLSLKHKERYKSLAFFYTLNAGYKKNPGEESNFHFSCRSAAGRPWKWKYWLSWYGFFQAKKIELGGQVEVVLVQSTQAGQALFHQAVLPTFAQMLAKFKRQSHEAELGSEGLIIWSQNFHPSAQARGGVGILFNCKPQALPIGSCYYGLLRLLPTSTANRTIWQLQGFPHIHVLAFYLFLRGRRVGWRWPPVFRKQAAGRRLRVVGGMAGWWGGGWKERWNRQKNICLVATALTRAVQAMGKQ